MTKTVLGFTLIELLVVIAIIGTLVAVLLPQLNNFNREQALKNAAADLKSNIRKTQNNAASGLNCNSNGLAATKWTLTFIQGASTYSIIATCSDLGNSLVSTSYSFPAGITIGGIKLGTCQIIDPDPPVPPSKTSLIFNNISSAINFTTTNIDCPISPSTNSMTLILQDINSNTTKNVVIEKGGNVY